MFHIPAHKNTMTPAAQNDGSWRIPMMKRVSDIIDKTLSAEAKDNAWDKAVAESIQMHGQAQSDDYAKGFIDGKAEGFKEGLAWMKGRA